MDKMRNRVCQGNIFGFLPTELYISDVSSSKPKTQMMVVSICSECDPIKPWTWLRGLTQSGVLANKVSLNERRMPGT